MADSSSTVVVLSVTPLSTPPTTPARATGSFESAMTSIGGRSSWVSSSRVASVSPGRDFLTTTAPSFSMSKSKACMGWPHSSIT